MAIFLKNDLMIIYQRNYTFTTGWVISQKLFSGQLHGLTYDFNFLEPNNHINLSFKKLTISR